MCCKYVRGLTLIPAAPTGKEQGKAELFFTPLILQSYRQKEHLLRSIRQTTRMDGFAGYRQIKRPANDYISTIVHYKFCPGFHFTPFSLRLLAPFNFFQKFLWIFRLLKTCNLFKVINKLCVALFCFRFLQDDNS